MNPESKLIAELAWPLEARCLLAAARALSQPDPIGDKIALNELDWDKLQELASLHALTPALAQFFVANQPLIPSQLWESLQREKENVRAYNFFLLLELKRVIAALEDVGIPSLAWKGPSLTVDVYADLALRPCADLDLLLAADHMETAASMLGRLGYVEQDVDTGGHTRNFVRENPKAIIELHKTVVQPRFAIDILTEELIANKRLIATPVGEIPVAEPEILLLLLCIHAAKHHWDRLIWVCDIVALLLKYPAIDWSRVFALANTYRTERILSIGLILADSFRTGLLPERVLEKIGHDPAAMKLARQSLSWTLSMKSDHREVISKIWYHFRMREAASDWWPMLRFQVTNLLTPNSADRAWVRLSGRFALFYYILRPLRLLKVAIFRAR